MTGKQRKGAPGPHKYLIAFECVPEIEVAVVASNVTQARLKARKKWAKEAREYKGVTYAIDCGPEVADDTRRIPG